MFASILANEILTVSSIDETLTECRVCGQSLPAAAFSAHNGGLRSMCRSCANAYEVNRRLTLRGFDAFSFAALLAAQNGHCFFCDATVGDAGNFRLAVDHDHFRGCCGAGVKSCSTCVRGLCCSACNFGLEKMTAEALERLLDGCDSADDRRLFSYLAGAPLLENDAVVPSVPRRLSLVTTITSTVVTSTSTSTELALF